MYNQVISLYKYKVPKPWQIPETVRKGNDLPVLRLTQTEFFSLLMPDAGYVITQV